LKGKNIINISRDKLKKLLILKLLFIFTFVQIFLPAVSHSSLYAQEKVQDNYGRILDKAQELYYEGRFTESFNLVKSCLTDSDISDEYKVKAYKILSQIMLARDEKNKAIEFIKQILKIDPGYNPTIEQEPPKFVELVNTVRSEVESQPVEADSKPVEIKEQKSNHWPWYAAGAAVVGIGAYIILKNGDNKDDPLKEPPAWPER
jgi:tetratricopeptide (TPR) repeat protein